MANEQKETDLSILLRFIAYCAGTNLLIDPLPIVKQAMDMLDASRTKPDFPHTASKFINLAQSLYEARTRHKYSSKAPGYLVGAATYILIHTDEKKQDKDAQLARGLYNTLSECTNIRFDNIVIGRTIQEIKLYKQTAPPTYDIFAEFDAIAKGKNLNQVDWRKLLKEIDKYHVRFDFTYPYYMMLHGLLMQIEYPIIRVDVLGHLEDVADKVFGSKRAKDFITEAGWLVSLYTKINTRGLNYPTPKLWKDRDLNEFALLMDTIQPQELVAISQSMIEAKYVTNEKFGFIPHILRSEKYVGKVITNRGFDFCQGLYYAQGAVEWMISGEGDAYDQLPSLDTHDIKFINECYDVFVNYQIERIRKKSVILDQRLKNELDYYQELYDSLSQECKRDNSKRIVGALPAKAYNSIYARLRDLTAYVSQKVQELNGKEVPVHIVQVDKGDVKRIIVGDIIRPEQKPTTKAKQKYCTYIVPNAGKTRDEIEADLERASKKSAKTFVNLLLSYEREGYLDFREESTPDIFEYLKKRYNLTYTSGNFARYFNQ